MLTQSTLKYMGAIKADFSSLSVNNTMALVKDFLNSDNVSIGEPIDVSKFQEFLNEKYPFKEQDDLFEVDDPVNDKLNQEWLSVIETAFDNFTNAYKTLVSNIDQENRILYNGVMAQWKKSSAGGG